MLSTQQIADNLKGRTAPGFKNPVPLSKTCLFGTFCFLSWSLFYFLYIYLFMYVFVYFIFYTVSKIRTQNSCSVSFWSSFFSWSLIQYYPTAFRTYLKSSIACERGGPWPDLKALAPTSACFHTAQMLSPDLWLLHLFLVYFILNVIVFLLVDQVITVQDQFCVSDRTERSFYIAFTWNLLF